MTVIAYRDGVMAGDTATGWGGDLRTFRDTKVYRFQVGETILLVGASGDPPSAQKFVNWIREGMTRPWPEMNKGEDFAALVAHDDGRIEYWTEKMVPVPTAESYFAIGSGMGHALCAMDAGATAERAVAIAIRRHPGCDGEITSVRFGDGAS